MNHHIRTLPVLVLIGCLAVSTARAVTVTIAPAAQLSTWAQSTDAGYVSSNTLPNLLTFPQSTSLTSGGAQISASYAVSTTATSWTLTGDVDATIGGTGWDAESLLLLSFTLGEAATYSISGSFTGTVGPNDLVDTTAGFNGLENFETNLILESYYYESHQDWHLPNPTPYSHDFDGLWNATAYNSIYGSTTGTLAAGSYSFRFHHGLLQSLAGTSDSTSSGQFVFQLNDISPGNPAPDAGSTSVLVGLALAAMLWRMRRG